MHQLVVNHFNGVARLYDPTADNPVELTVGRHSDGIVTIVAVDRDGGNTELVVNVSREQLLAAVAMTALPSTCCEDCHATRGQEGGV
jgi:hypothetical protein